MSRKKKVSLSKKLHGIQDTLQGVTEDSRFCEELSNILSSLNALVDLSSEVEATLADASITEEASAVLRKHVNTVIIEMSIDNMYYLLQHLFQRGYNYTAEDLKKNAEEDLFENSEVNLIGKLLNLRKGEI